MLEQLEQGECWNSLSRVNAAHLQGELTSLLALATDWHTHYRPPILLCIVEVQNLVAKQHPANSQQYNYGEVS